MNRNEFNKFIDYKAYSSIFPIVLFFALTSQKRLELQVFITLVYFLSYYLHPTQMCSGIV